jgi:DNA-binding beta-propeller fold protein YncE
MALKHIGSVMLPAHTQAGGFDHAAVHRRSGRLYVAHTANDTIDVIDCAADRYLHSIPNLTGVAGALVSDERDFIFTSNRGENTVGIFSPDQEANLVKVSVGVKPNGLSFDPQRGLLLAANAGDPIIPGSFTVSLVDVAQREMMADIPVSGRTRWTIFDTVTDAFYVNIADPAEIVVIDAKQPTRIAQTWSISAAGPHGLDRDAERRRLFCACDAKKLITLDMVSGATLHERELSGMPDVIFFNAALQHLYVAIGDPGVIDVFDTESLQRIAVVSTEKGAHTIGFDPDRNKVYAFLPNTHSAAVYRDEVR